MGQLKIDTQTIEEATHCIKTHRYRGAKKPVTKEAQILFNVALVHVSVSWEVKSRGSGKIVGCSPCGYPLPHIKDGPCWRRLRGREDRIG